MGILRFLNPARLHDSSGMDPRGGRGGGGAGDPIALFGDQFAVLSFILNILFTLLDKMYLIYDWIANFNMCHTM